MEGKVCGPFKGNSVSQTSDYRLASAKISQYGHDGSLSNKCVSAETA